MTLMVFTIMYKTLNISHIVSTVTGLPRVAFTITHTYRIPTELGFEVKEFGSGKIKEIELWSS